MHQGRQHHEGGRCDVGALRGTACDIIPKKSAIVVDDRGSPHINPDMPDQTSGVPIN